MGSRITNNYLARAIVSTNNIGQLQDGSFIADIIGGAEDVMVTYVAAAFSPTAGCIMIPEEGQEVIVANIDGGWYYQGTVVSDAPATLPSELDIDAEKDLAQPPHQLINYDTAGNPCTATFSYDGARLELSRESTSNREDRYVLLESPTKKKLLLSDNTWFDSIILENEHGDGLTITSNNDFKDLNSPVRGAKLESWGPLKLRSARGEIGVQVKNGQELTISNSSNGFFSNGPPYGNVNIESQSRNVNILTGADPLLGFTGTINLFAMGTGGAVQIDCGLGGITIHTKGALNIQSDLGNIDIAALGGSINMFATAGINMLSPAGVKIDGGSLVGIDGAMIHLNNGMGKNAGALPAIVVVNEYGHPYAPYPVGESATLAVT